MNDTQNGRKGQNRIPAQGVERLRSAKGSTGMPMHVAARVKL